jgi:DNA repair protein SbcC/Rad50
MKPIKLKIRAFGPFTEEQVLDFRLLGNRFFFLIHGPTGAGKTSILDAICFALYGDTSGNERNGKQMRSDHADRTTLTEVTFDFSLGAEVYRVTRSPEQERPRRRGEGTTTECQRATLWRRTGPMDDTEEGAVVATQWSRVTEEIERLMGFRSDQFRQVVMLPQGEFQRLLLANSRERQEIFEMLFQTEVYRQIEEELRRAGKEIADQIEQFNQHRQFILQQAKTASGEELAQRREETCLRLLTITNSLTEIRNTEKAAQESLNQGRQVIEKFRECEAAKTVIEGLENRSSEIANKQMVLLQARKATSLLGVERALTQSLREQVGADRNLGSARNAFRLSVEIKQTAENTLREARGREGEREAAQRNLAQLEQLSTKVNELEKARQELIAANVEVQERTLELESARLSLAEYQQAIENYQQELRKAQQDASLEMSFQHALEYADRMLRERRQLALKRVELEDAKLDHQKATAELTDANAILRLARQEYDDLNTLWFRGQAAILAQQLQPGMPCPVCGSPEHPAPAHSEQTLPTEAALKKKHVEVERFGAAVERVVAREAEHSRKVTSLESRVEVLLESLGDVSRDDVRLLETKISTLQEKLTQARQAREKAPSLELEICQLNEQELAKKDAIDNAEKSLQAATVRLQRNSAVVAERENGVPGEFRCLNALTQAKEQADNRIKALKGALEKSQRDFEKTSTEYARREATFEAAKNAVEVAQQRVIDALKEFGLHLEANDFESEQAFQEAKKTISSINTLEAEVQRFHGDLQAAKDRFARGRQAIENLTYPEIDKLELLAEKVKEDLERSLREEATCREQLNQMDCWLKDLCNIGSQLQLLEERYAVVGRIADVANGRNSLGITFQRFVLSALLEDVLIAASERFRIMSKGRFSLQRACIRTDQRTAGGLDLEVDDAYTGTRRAVSTLSGGEKFLASLALALGLADVVQSYAGGIHLETIFVDEGFGGLDPEALDCALNALIDLQQCGRMVGIISHVPELKERIDVRLEVTTLRGSSRAQFVVA